MPENKGVQYKIVINGRESIKEVPADKVSTFERNAKAKGYSYKKIEPVPAPKPAPAPVSSQKQVNSPDSNNNATKELKLGNIPQQDSLPNSALYKAPSPIKKEVRNNSINPSFGNVPKKTINDYNKTQTKEYSPAQIEPQKQGQTFGEALKENQDKINPTPQREYSNENMATIQAGEIINPNEPLYQEMVTNNPEVLKAEQEYERTKGKFMGAGSEIKAKQAYEKAKDDAYNAYISKKNEDNTQDGTQGNGSRKEYIQSPSYDRVEIDGEIKYVPKGSAFDTDANNATEWNSRVARNVENKEIVAENTRQEFETTLADDSIADNKKRDKLRQLAGNIYTNQVKRLEKLYNTGQINDATKSHLMNKSARAYRKLQKDGDYTIGNAFTTDRILDISTAGVYGLVKSVADVLAYDDIEGNDRKVYDDVINMFTNGDENTRDNTFTYDVVSGALESIPYMMQMGYSFGVGTALQASTKATSKGVAKYLLSKGLSKKALKSTNKIANGIVQATVFAAISPETYKGVIEDGREEFGADFKFSDITGEMILRNFAQSSMTALIERSGSLMNKLVPKQFVTNLQAQTPQVIRKVISSTGALQGIVPEYMEEKIEELSNIVVWNEGTWEQFFNPQQNLVTLGVCGLLQSPTIATQTNSIARNKYKSSRNLGIVRAYDKGIADKLKQASRIENPDERMKAYASSGITSIQSIEGQKAAVAFVLHKEAVINQRLLIREEMGENIKSRITLNIARMGLSYKNSEGRDVIHQAITTDNNGTQRMFYVLGSSVGGLVPVKEVVDGNISPKKTFVSEKLFEGSEQIVDDVLDYIEQTAFNVTEQEKASSLEEDNKAEAMDTMIEQENAQAMQNVINDVQEEEANVLASLEDNEIRQGTIVYDKYDTKEEKTELEVISVDGEQAEVRLENGKTVLLPVEELNVVMQTTPNAQELSMQAIEETASETAPETTSETGQEATSETGQEATSETGQEATSETGQEATSETGQEATSETGQEYAPEEVDIYDGFPRTKQGEIDINKLSPEQTIIYAENELGKEFAVKQVKQTHDTLTARKDSLIKKMAKQSIKEAIKTKKQIDALDAEIDVYSIYLNDNGVLGVIPQEDLNTETKTREERLAYVDEVAEATPRGYLLRGIARGEFKFVWGGERGVASELGFYIKNKKNKKGEKVSSSGERRARIGILSNNGFTPDTLGEHLADRFEGMIDALDARSLVIEVLNEVTNQREALEALENSFVERDDYMRRYEEEESERIALEEAEREELEITIKAYYESSYNGFLKELDEEHAKLAEYASQMNVPQELIESTYSTFDLITLIEEYGNNEQENSNERGSDASNGISSSEREVSERDRGGINETELNSRRDTVSESETKSDSENGLQEVQADNIRKGIDYDNNREQGFDKVSGEEQSREANEVLEQSEPQTSGGLDRSRTTESQAPVSESNIQGSSNALSSETTSQEADNARGEGETKTKSTTESNTNDDLLHFSNEEVQIIDSLNEFVSKNKLTTKARFIHSNSKEFAEKTKRIPENNKKGVTGWYNQSTNEVIIVLDNLTGDKLNEAKKTYLHEVIGHQSLYNALGKEAHTELMNDIYNVIPKIYRAKFDKDHGQAFKEQLLEEGISPENIEAEYNKRVDEIIAKQVESELTQYNGNITEYADEFFAYNAENINLDQDTKKSFIDTIKNFIERIFGIKSNDDFIQGLIDTAINYNINQDKIDAQKKVDRFKALVDNKIDRNAGSKAELAKEVEAYTAKEETAEQQKIAELKEKKAKLYAELKAKMNQLNAGLDPELIIKAVEIININAQLGMIKFNQVAKEMIDILGDKIKPFVKDIYNMARTSNDEYAEEFDTREYVEKFDLNKGFKEEIIQEKEVTPEENPIKPLKNTKDDVSLQGTLFDEQILETLKPKENEQQYSNNGQRVLQGNSNRLSNYSQENLEQGGNRGDSRHESRSIRGTNGGIDKSNDGQGSILPTDVRVLNEEPAPALVEVQVSSNDDKSFNKNQKYKDNISALEVLLSLIKENRKATAQEKETLLKYVGFGGLKEVLLDPEKNKWNDSDLKYKDSVLRIIELANEFDNITGNKGTLEAIKGSTLNAHFTSDTLINAIYKGISHLGFNGGTILEPSSGIGNFITYMPNKLKRKSKISAIELDPLTGNILKYIHDDVNVKISGYENANISENSFDLVISNVPFGNYKVFDPTFKGDKTKFTNKIHGYFFAKAIDSVRDGGIIAFVTSTGVMDSNSNKELREYIVSKANFIGAVRLPNTAFKNVANTRVVTDVIFLQKGKHKDTINQNELFINSSTMEVNHKDGEVENVTVSDYFQNFPDYVLGTMVAGGLYSRNDYSVEDNGSYKKINDIITKILPKNIYTNTESGVGLHVNDKEVEISDFKEGNIALKEGKLYKKENGNVTEISINEPVKKIKDYIELRTTLIELIYAEYIGESTNDLQVRRDKLNSLYDRFVKDYGHLSKSIVKIAKHDADGYCVAALENKDKSKADIFTKQTINPIRRNQRAETVEDAMVVSLYENASIDIERIAELLGKSVQETIELSKGKIFENPTGGFVSRDEYLSGNVKKKYKEAKQAVEEGKKEFEYNMTELEAIIPNDIPAVQIEAKLGSRWIPDSVYTDFARELLQDDLIEIKYINATDEYVSIGSNPINALAINKYGTSRVNAMKIIIGALHINPPKVYKEIYENGATKRVTDEKETAKVKEKYEEVRDIFEDWVYKDTSRRDLLAKIYNEKYNTNVKRKYDGSNLYIAGINGIELRQHQKDAVWMLLQNNGGVIDHLVGAGKTFVMIVATMEMRRTNVAKKPMIMALKSTIPQIVESYRSAYPLAKILAPTEKDFKKENRLALFAKIANNEFDCIIMSHENYGKIPHEREIQEKLLNDELDALIREYSLLRDSGNGKDSKRAEQGLITRINNQKVKIEKLLSSPKDNTITFEQMGIDHIMVDESQQFKNLSYTTKMYGVAGLGVATGSKRAFNLLVGIRYLQEMYKGDKGTTFLSGTPISNSMVEMYSLLNYLRPNKLKELNINTFDSWATTFANPTTDIEFTVTGDFKQKTRIREFINVPELSTMYTEIADIRTDDNLTLDKPKMKGGGYSVIPITMSRDQEEFANNLILMAKHKDGKYIGRGLSDSDKKAIMLIVTNLSSKMAIDMRLIDSNYEYDRNGKIAKLVENVAKTFNETTPFLGTQLIFSDIGTPKTTSNKVALLKDYMEDELGINIDTINSVFGETTADNYKLPQMNSVRSRMIETLEITDVEFEDILSKATESAGQFNVYSETKERLIEAGVPADQIVFIHDYPSQKSKDKLFKDVNDGKVRIVLGSTQKLGTGVNVQKRIVAVHHLDVPWTPASMEQRNGRALRQGNKVAKEYMNNELPVYAYATERTLDTYKYQLLQTKQRFLTQVKSGDVEDRVISEGNDDGDSGVGYAELVAMLSGNQDILLKSKLEEKVKKLQRVKRNFEGEFDDAQSNLERLTEKSKQVKDNLEKTKIAYKGFPLKLDSEGKLLVDNVNGYKIKGEKDKEPTRIDYAKKAVDIIEKNLKSAKIGDVFDITLGDYHLKYWLEYEGKDLLSQKLVRRMSLVSNNELSFTFTYVSTAGVLLNNIQKKIEKDIPNLISLQETLLEKTIKDIELYKNIINKGRNWEKIEELNNTKQELKDVTERLQNSGDLEEEEYQSFIDVEGTLVKENLKEDDIRFREVPTNKNFVALHNIPEWKLVRVLKQGGFANPSVAVTIPEIAPFESYGEISFVAPKRLIDKKTGKNAGTFLGDAYTPRYPHIDYDIPSKKKEELIKRIFKNEILNKYNIQSDVSNRIIDGIEQKGDDEITLRNEVKMLFLAEKGIDFIKLGDRKYTDKEIDNLNKLGYAKKEIFEIKDNEEDKKLLTELWEVKNKERYGDEFEDAKQRLYVDGYLPILLMRDMLNDIKSEIKNPLKVSFYDNLDNAEKYVSDNNLNQEAEKFAYDLYNSLDVKEQIFDGFTPTGRRRYLSNTIENASKVMNKQGLEASEVTFGGGLGKLRALVAPKLTSTDKIAKFRSLIVSEDEFETIKVNLEDVYDDISDKLAGKDGSWDTGITRLAEVINLSNPSEYLKKEYDLEISDELNNQIKEFRTQLLSMPTEYFETKFQRPVYVAEFSGVLIPSNASEEVKVALNRIGIKVKEYTEDSERQTKLNELIDDLEASEQIRFRENKQFQDEQRTIQKISNKTYDIFNLNEEIRFRMGNKARANYNDILKTKRADLSKEGRDTFLEYLDGIDDKKKEKVTFNWFAKGTIIVPEDMYKVEQAIKVADIKKIDPMQFNSPMEIIDKFSDVEIKGDRINPDNVKTLSNKVDYGNGITVYDVEDSEQGRKDMREIINTHFGKKSSPWCLLQGDENGELTEESADYWKQYNKIPKRVAFLNGKLLAFSANSNSDIIWWDKTDNSYEGIPITQRIPNDEMKRTGTMLFNEESKQLGKFFNMFKGNKTNGLYENWYDNGQLREHINYKDGKRDGLYEWWNMDGQLKERNNYKNGELNGLYEWWTNDGQLRERSNYKDGKLHGLHELWYDNGQLWERRNYKDGKLNGLYEEFDKNGKLTYSVIYSQDVPIKDNLKEDEGIRYRLREKPAPKNTIKAYKLFRTDDKGNLYTLFIDNNVPLKIGSWYDADSPQMDVLSKLPHTEGEKEIYLINKDNTFELWSGDTKLPKISEVNNASISQARYIQVSDGKNGRMYHNVGINGANGVSLYAMRAGLHSTNVPSAHHIGKGRAGAKAVNRPDNQVWAEIEVSADINYQDEALSNAPIVTSKSSPNYGKPNMAMAQITDKIPVDGYYIYQTNTNANKAQDWIISGAMKINKVLDDNTTKKIARDLGFDEDLPRVQEKIDRFNELLNGNTDIRYRTINIDGKERPTTNSLGKPIANTEEGLRNFWKWFGDSKVVDSEGLPLVVYHGTNADFSEFNVGNENGIFFTESPRIASGYAENIRKGKLVIHKNQDGYIGSNVIPVYLSLKNPNIINFYNQLVVGVKTKINKSIQKGYDSIIIINGKDFMDSIGTFNQYVAFSPTQIKSVNNNGDFNPDNNDIRFRRNNPIQSKVDLFNDLLNTDESNTKKAISKFESNKDKINELAKKVEINYFNKIKPLDEINKIIEKEGLYKRYDVYRETSNYVSRVHAKSEKFNETLGQRYIEAMGKIKEKTGFSYEEIGDYHMAIYMPEYTERMLKAKIDNDSYIMNWQSELDILKENDSGDTSKKKKYLQGKIEERTNVIKEKYKDGLAGEKGFAEDLKKRGFDFTTPEEYVKHFESKVDDKALIEELKASLRDINQFSLRIGYETGQISKEQYEEFRSNPNYVPLRGWSETFDDSGEANPFQMLNMTGRGRKSKASNPINYIFAQAYTVINFGELNEVKRKLAKLALMNSSNEAFKELFGYNEMYEGNLLNEEGEVEPFRAYSKEEFDQLQGVIEDGLIVRRSKEKYDNKQRQVNPHKYSEEYQKHILTFYDKGIRHELYIEDKRIVESFKSDSVSQAFTKFRKLTSMMTRLMTSRNLSFIVPNLIRDLGSAFLLNVYSSNPKEDMRFKKEIMQNMAKYTPMVWKGIWKHDWDSQTMELYNNWELDGGKTGWLQTFKNIADLGKDIEKRLDRNDKEKMLMDLVKLKPIENLAEFSESIIRFATYVTALKNGYTRADAAFMSNDVSLNYNLKGKQGNWLKSIYGFFNAAIAGTYKVYNFAKTHPKQFAAATFGLMLAGYGQWWLSELLDDDNDKRSEYRKQRMINLFGIGIPISYDLVPVFRAGYLIAEIIHGDKMTNTEFAYELMMSPTEILPEQVQTAFNFLVNYDEDIDRLRYLNWEHLSELSPTILLPITDVVVNRNFMGRDIVKESKFLDIPNSANYDEYQVTNFDKLAAFVINGIDQFDWKNHDERSKFTSKGDERIIDVSPAHVNHILRGYLSGVYQTVAGTIEAVDMLTDDKPNDANKLAGKLPVINRFYIGTNENIPVYKTIEVLDRRFGTIVERATEKRRLVRDKSLSESEREKYREEFYKIVNTPEFEKARVYEREKKEIYSLMRSIRFAANLNDKEKENKLRQQLSIKLLEFKN